jgi:hypothetical protein
VTTKKETSFLATACFIALVAGCQALGVPTAKTFNEELLAGYTTAAQVLSDTDALLKAGKLDKADAANIEQQTDNVKAGLDIARTVHTTDTTAGSAKLTQVLQALQGISAYLATKEK